jgi:predicted esterase
MNAGQEPSMRTIRLLAALPLLLSLGAAAADAIAPIPRRLPAPGVALPDAERARLEAALAQLDARIAKAGAKPLIADVAVFAKAVRLALRCGEFYDPVKDVAKADWALKQADERLGQLDAAPWAKRTGLVVRGYESSIDGAALPYGLVIPEKLDLGKPAPLYVWLHGRGEKDTDLHFLSERTRGAGEVHPADAIVVHAFGRQCVGFKGAGEIDVMELIAHVQASYRIDPDRIALLGFSMGGAGAKHLGAHYTDHFAVIHSGAGFAETARYNNLKPEDVPAYERTLWGDYDVPDYIRNLFNVPFIAYSGEKDKQIQGARVLEEAFAANGRTLVHLIGPGVGHQYQPDTLKQVLALVHDAVAKGRPAAPATVSFETRTLRYDHMFWVQALGLEEHWRDARIDATAAADGLAVTTANVASLALTWPGLAKAMTVTIDGQRIAHAPAAGKALATLTRQGGTWSEGPLPAGLRKVHGLQGPIDDAFMAPFLVVMPSGTSAHPRFQRWCDFERQHFIDRWAALMRGEARVKLDTEVGPDDLERFHLVLWGDAQSNRLLARIADRLPIRWSGESIVVGARTFDAASHAPAFIYPNPLNPARYVVVDSGLTFREAHDATNSQQNPKLPDWAVIDLAKDPDEHAPGGIADAGFFDEQWKLKP